MGNPIEVYGVAVVVVGMVLFDVSVAQFEGGGNSPFRDGDGSGRRQVEMVPAMFVFGDSLIDNGNNNNLPSFAKANYFPYGIDFNGGPTGRFSNGYTMVDEIGMVWVHFIKLMLFSSFFIFIFIALQMHAAELLGLPLIPAFSQVSGPQSLHGVNYASAAAGILDATGRNFVSVHVWM